MKITKFYTENILKLKAVSITPKSEIIELKGDNEQGKSSILHSIVMGLKGDRELPPVPIRKGAKKGLIEMTLDGDPASGIPPFKITRRITEKGASTNIEPIEILNGLTPRAFLDKIVGKISFDPEEFAKKSKAEQRTIGLQVMGIDYQDFDKREKEIFDQRTLKGRELKAAEVKFKSLKHWDDITETAEISFASMSEKLTEAMQHNQSIIDRTDANEKLKAASLVMRDSMIPAAKERIEELRKQLAEAENNLVTLESTYESNREKYRVEKELLFELKPIDISDLNTQISNIDTLNSKIRDNATYRVEKENLTSLWASYEALDTALSNIRQERIDAITNAKFPIPGVSFDDDGMLYDGLPFSQCSSGKQLMISLAISMELNPTLRIILIRDGSLLGPTNKKIIHDMLEEKKKQGLEYQVWMEVVADKSQYDATGKVGIYIEEGEVIEDDGEPAKKVEAKTEVEKETKRETRQEKPEPKKTIIPREVDDWD